MGFTYRMAAPADRDSYIDFINYVFSHDHRPHDFKSLLPKEYGDGRQSCAAHFLALDGAGHIRGLVAALPFEMRVFDRCLKFAYVGSVSVHPYARGEGHMKQLMAMAEAWMDEQQVDVAALGGQRQRYQYFGYSKGGMGIRYAFNEANLRHALRAVDCDDLSVEEITDAGDARIAALWALHADQPVRVPREKACFFDICHSWNNRLYAFMRGGVCAGYLVANDNHSIAEFVMADAADYPRAMKRWMRSTGAQEIDVLAQVQDQALIAFLAGAAEDVTIGTSLNLRVFHWEPVLSACLSLKQDVSGISDGECHLSVDGQPLRIRCRDGVLSVDAQASADAAQFTALELQERLFSPSALLHAPTVGGAPLDWFPLPLGVPACDGF